ncbi:MAG: hypothetical protein E6182_18365 [Clostridioides difficile]|nr:hypothetical protein [Clostridioides difficile]
MEKYTDYQKIVFNSLICTAKSCKKKRIFIKKDEEKLKINKIDGELWNYHCDCGNNIKFKY